MDGKKIAFGTLIIILSLFFFGFNYLLEKKENIFKDLNVSLYFEKLTNAPILEEKDEKITESSSNEEKKTNNTYIPNYIAILEIPKIALKRGLVDINSYYNNVEYNIAIIKGSNMPSINKSNLILAAHSGSSYISYFKNLYKLSNDDLIYLYYNNVKYTYKIVRIYNETKDGTIGIYRDQSKNTITLITCTKDSDTLQTIYIGELLNSQ